MEQNLSERERKQRLVIGIVLWSIALALLIYGNVYAAIGVGIAGAGFIANYFTCFCGTKKIVNKLKSRFL